MALYKISSSRVNNIDADQFSGSPNEEGLIWYDPSTGVLRLHNGQRGGQILGGSSGGGGGGGVIDLSAVAQDIIPATADQYSLGTAEKRWKDLFVSDGTVYIGDTKLSNSNGTLLIGDLVSADPDRNTAIRVDKDINDYVSLSLTNINQGNKSSADVILYQSDKHYIDIGVASPNYAYPGFEIIEPKDTYVIGAGGGHIKIGTDSADADVVFFAGGVDSLDRIVARFSQDRGLVLSQGGVTFTDGTYMDTSGSPIKLRRDVANIWTLGNPVLSAGEPGLETDTSYIKYGDGVTAWNDLAYAVTSTSVSSSPPNYATPGMLWFDISVDQLKVFVESSQSWESIAPKRIRYSFTESNTWLVEHNRNTTVYNVNLTDSDGELFYAKIKIINSNSFSVILTAATSGVVDVTFI